MNFKKCRSPHIRLKPKPLDSPRGKIDLNTSTRQNFSSIMVRPLLCILLLGGVLAHGQGTESYDIVEDGGELPQLYQSRKNLVKFNLTGLLLKNYQFQGERVINRTFSLGLSYGFIPQGGIP